jgi:hypothetical protein
MYHYSPSKGAQQEAPWFGRSQHGKQHKQKKKQTRDVSHYDLAIYIKKHLKAKEEL